MGLMKSMDSARRGRRGQIMVILALAAVGLVGIAALGIDVFYIYWNKNRLQSGTDAAALAGATYFNNVTFSGNNALCALRNRRAECRLHLCAQQWRIVERTHQRGRQYEQSVDDRQRDAQGIRTVRQGRGHPKLYRERHFRGGAAGTCFRQ